MTNEDMVDVWMDKIGETYFSRDLSSLTMELQVFADWLGDVYGTPQHEHWLREFTKLLPKWLGRKIKPKDDPLAIVAWSVVRPQRKGERDNKFRQRLVWPDNKAPYAEVVCTILLAIQRYDDTAPRGVPIPEWTRTEVSLV